MVRLLVSARHAAPTILLLLSLAVPAAAAEQAPRSAAVSSLEDALLRTWRSNPDIQAQRAQVRAVREAEPQARAGLLPQVSATAYAGVLATRSLLRGTPINIATSDTLGQRGVALTATQTLFDGWRTQNSIVQAERLTAAKRQQLRATEQSMLLDVATTFIAVRTGLALVEVQRKNVDFLTTTLATIRTRLAAGVATPTDVTQAEARLARGIADLNAVQADLVIARDRFAKLVGAPAGERLRPTPVVDRLLPASRDIARDKAGHDNPAVLAAAEAVKAADAAVRAAQGQMLPQVGVQGQAARDYDTDSSTRRVDSLQVVGRVTVPLYAGGGPEAQVRQNRELVGVALLQLDSARLQARSAAYGARVGLDTAGIAIRAASEEVRAGEATVEGIRRQLEQGIRTVTELLNAQQDAVAARARLAQATGDRAVAAFTLLAAVGRLGLNDLGIRAKPLAEPQPPPDMQVRFDSWRDLRTVPPLIAR